MGSVIPRLRQEPWESHKAGYGISDKEIAASIPPPLCGPPPFRQGRQCPRNDIIKLYTYIKFYRTVTRMEEKNVMQNTEEMTSEQLMQQNQQMLRELNMELTKLKRAQARVKRRTTFLLSIIAMLVLVTSTLAWFTLSNFASVNDIQLKISVAPELFVDIENQGSDDLSLWKKTITTDMVNTALTSTGAPTLDQQLLDPVTSSDGISFFSQSGTNREANKTSYIEFKLWFIATKEMYVHLSGQTVEITAKDGTVTTGTSSVTTTETDARADIVNAVRVSFEDGGTAAIWEPNQGTPVNNQNTFDVSTTFNDSTRIFHLDAMTPKEITVRIWAEGNDPECDNDVQNADVAFNFLFGGTDETNSSFE